MKDYTVHEVHEALTRDTFLVIDIREAPELRDQHVPGMLHLPMSELQDRLDELPTDREIVLFCRSGNRSARTADYLNGLGDWQEVANCVGGILAWADAGLPYEGDRPF